MARHYRINAYWAGRRDAVSVMAAQIAAFFAAIGEIHPALRGFLFQTKDMASPAEGTSHAACAEALRRSAGVWQTGDTERTSYGPRFFLERRIEPPVEVVITCGIEPLDLGPIFVPNRLELVMRADIGDEIASRAAIEGILRGAVSAFSPDFGFAGTDTVPDAPMALFSSGKPPAGWMTYLRAGYPAIPQTLPQPAAAYPIDRRGTLIVAHPKLFHDADPEQRAAIDRVRDALRSAGVLIPAHELHPRA